MKNKTGYSIRDDPRMDGVNDMCLRRIWEIYLREAIKKRVRWELSAEQFSWLIGERCLYCMREPFGILAQTFYRRKFPNFRFTGIDQVVPGAGYFVGNVIPACSPDNNLRGSSSVIGYALHVATCGAGLMETDLDIDAVRERLVKRMERYGVDIDAALSYADKKRNFGPRSKWAKMRDVTVQRDPVDVVIPERRSIFLDDVEYDQTVLHEPDAVQTVGL